MSETERRSRGRNRPEAMFPAPAGLKYMRKFAEAWPERAIVQAALAQIPWYHNLALLEKCNDSQTRLWSARKTVENGWSRNGLALHPDDKPTIGLLLCKSKNRLVAEYTLRGFNQPMGIAEWQTQISRHLPEELRGSLPTIEEIEAELGGEVGE